MRRQRGLTLIELMISLVLIGAISVVIGGLALDAQHTGTLAAAYAQDVTETRRALDAVERDLRAATDVAVTPFGLVATTDGAHVAWTLDRGSLRRGDVVVARNIAAFDVRRDGACYVVSIALGHRAPNATRTARVEAVVRPRAEIAR
jgi:prepilin-type N-terminal cleavage/methylation domain-containing protein